jgi:flagellar basal body-associated protein FliL
VPIAVVAVVILLAGLALSFAFTSLTSEDGNVSAATTAPAQPSETPTQSVPTAPPATATSAASAAIPGSGG